MRMYLTLAAPANHCYLLAFSVQEYQIMVVSGYLGKFAADWPRSTTTVSRFSLSLFWPTGLSVTWKLRELPKKQDPLGDKGTFLVTMMVDGGYHGQFSSNWPRSTTPSHGSNCLSSDYRLGGNSKIEGVTQKTRSVRRQRRLSHPRGSWRRISR